jgi:hypothetical protein
MKTLILGCSFTAGSYYVEDGIERIDNTYGWYDELPKDNHYDVYSFPGGGLLNFSHLLQTIDLSSYSHCIIQQTWEPRFALYNDTDFLPTVSRDNIDVTIKKEFNSKLFVTKLNEKPQVAKYIGTNNRTTFDRHAINYLTKLGDNPYTTSSIPASACLVNNLLQQHGIDSYTFSVFDEYNVDRYMPYVKKLDFDIESFYEIFIDYQNEIKDGVFGHFNRTGTQIFGQLVADALTKYHYDKNHNI